MKLSHFKQMLKSCRGGVSMLIHRLPGNQRNHKLSSFHQKYQVLGRDGDRSLSDFNSPLYLSYQAPGTPGSNLSETTGYYSTQSTSLPSVCSAAVSSPNTPDVKTAGIPSFSHRAPFIHQKSTGQSQTSQHSGYETDQTSFESHYKDVPTATNNQYTSRPTDISSYPRPLCLGVNDTSRTRMSSQSSYSSSVLSPKLEPPSRFAYSSRNNHQSSSSSAFLSSVPQNSSSVDRLETHRAPRRPSGDHHVTSSSSLGPHSLSLSNVYRMELGKRTNV